MARGRRKCIIQSRDEYLSDEHVGQESSTRQNAVSSELPPTGGEDLVESDDDVELNVEDENGHKGKRGRNKLKDIWNLPKGLRIVVRCNDLDQPIGDEAGHLGKFLGMVARNGCLCSLSYKDWRLLIRKRERNTNEEKNKKDILKQVKMRFLYPSRMEKWILRTIGERWRQHKSNLKSLYFDEHKSMEVNCSTVPRGVIDDQWIALVNNWMTQKAKEISKTNRINCAKKKSTHTAGTKSFARNREELDNLKELLVQQPDLADSSQGKIAWKGDALNQILGEDKPGHVHGLGLVPDPNKVFDQSTSRRFKNINLTSLDPTSSEDVLSLRLQLEKVQNHANNQDANILELKQKTKILEERQLNQGCLDDSLPRNQDVIYVDRQYTKRKRVYGGPQSELNMFEQQNNTMGIQSDAEYEDLEPPNKYSSAQMNKRPMRQNDSTHNANENFARYKSKEVNSPDDADVLQHYRISTEAHNTQAKHFSEVQDRYKHINEAKVLNQETSSYSAKLDISHSQKKMNSKGPSAKQQHGTLNRLTTKSLPAGTKVFLKSWKSQNKDVALATVISCDPSQKLDGVQLGHEFWMVRVSIAMAKDEPLLRPYKSYNLIGDAEGANIAWPSTFVYCSFK
ncbi:hypothetical protein ACP70R_023241 [Stipagrostis hirtigluma subsp. patula]